MHVCIDPSWQKALEPEFAKDYFLELTNFVKKEYQQATVYPPPKHIFRAFELTPFNDVRVVILGQDPYHWPDQANGLCFSVSEGVKIPPSLRNIYKEIQTDMGSESHSPNGDLTDWAKQGVLLINSTLTVRDHEPNSHKKAGWEQFTDTVIKTLSDQQENLAFILWGASAQRKGEAIDDSKHLVIRSPHPSPLSSYRGFFGSRPFSQCNAYLDSHGTPPITW